MTFAQALPYHSTPRDRSQSEEGVLIRRLLGESVRPTVSRSDEALQAVMQGLAGTQPFGSYDTFMRAVELLSALPPGAPLPRVIVESEDELGLDWDEGARRVLSLTVDESSMVGFAALLGHDTIRGRVDLADYVQEIPETLRLVLQRFYPAIG